MARYRIACYPKKIMNDNQPDEFIAKPAIMEAPGKTEANSDDRAHGVCSFFTGNFSGVARARHTPCQSMTWSWTSTPPVAFTRSVQDSSLVIVHAVRKESDHVEHQTLTTPGRRYLLAFPNISLKSLSAGRRSEFRSSSASK